MTTTFTFTLRLLIPYMYNIIWEKSRECECSMYRHATANRSIDGFYRDSYNNKIIASTYRKRRTPVFAIAYANPRMPLPMMALLKLKTDIPNVVFPSNCEEIIVRVVHNAKHLTCQAQDVC